MRSDEMSADDRPLDRPRNTRPASLPMRVRSRRWPVRRFERELFLSAHARKRGQGHGADQALETEQDNSPGRRCAMNKLSHKRVVDKLIDAYVSWREACLRVSDAYGSWARAMGPGARSADPMVPRDGTAHRAGLGRPGAPLSQRSERNVARAAGH